MAKARVSSEEVMRRVEEDRLRKQQVEEPFLIAFRATPEEIEMRRVEDAREVELPDDRLRRWAERIGRCGREGVRFERYLVRQGFYPGVSKDSPQGREPDYQAVRSNGSAT
jgi:hypothetical protein